MKKITTILLIFIGFVSISQSNFTVFNNDGKQFYVIMNGIKQNSVPQTNVFVSGIKNGSYSVKVIFADGVTGDLNKNFFIEEPSDITTRVVFNDGKGKLQLIGMAPTAGAMQEETAVVYRSNDSAIYTDAVVVNQTITTTNTTSTTNTTNSANNSMNSGETINMNVGMNTGMTNQGMNVNINITDPTMNNGNGNVNMNIGVNGNGTQTNGNTQYSQTTTSTTVTSTGGNIQTSNSNYGTVSNNSTVNTQGNCRNILDNAPKMVEDLKDLMMDDDKVDAIKLDLESYCLTASQAYKLVETLSFESSRLEASKFLFNRMIDKDKGNTLLPLFTFDSSKMEYREYMNKNK
jgi:hypothetical protein